MVNTVRERFEKIKKKVASPDYVPYAERQSKIAEAQDAVRNSVAEMQRSSSLNYLDDQKNILKNQIGTDGKVQRINQTKDLLNQNSKILAEPQPGKGVGGAGYVALKAGQGLAGAAVGAEAAARSYTSNEIAQARRAAEAEKQGFWPGMKQNVIGGAADAIDDYQWDKDKSWFSNVIGGLGAGAQAVGESMQGLTGMQGAQNEIVQRFVKNYAEKNGISMEEAWKRAENFLMEDNALAKLLNYDENSEMLQLEAEHLSDAARIGGEIASAATGLAPAVAIGVATKNPVAGKAVMSGIAGGNTAREAYNQGADVNEAFSAGFLTGAKEYAIESLFGKMPGLGTGKLFSPSKVKDAAGNVSTTATGAKIADYFKSAFGEGAEEAASTYLQSFIDEATWADEAERASLKEIVSSFGLGAAMSLILGVPVMFDSNGKMRVEDEEYTGKLTGKTEYYPIIKQTVDKAIANEGTLGEKYNQIRLSEVPEDIRQMVLASSNGKIDLTGKFFALEGGSLWHEYDRHSDVEKEASRGQIAFTPATFAEAIEICYAPDFVESLFVDGNNPTQRQSFAFVKKEDGYYIVVEAVGGKRNPNIVPVEIIRLTEQKWDNYIRQGKTIGDMLYENNKSMLEGVKNGKKDEKNQVTAAQFASDQTAVARTPRSPQSFYNSIAQPAEGVNSQPLKTAQNAAAASDVPVLSGTTEEMVDQIEKWANDTSSKGTGDTRKHGIVRNMEKNAPEFDAILGQLSGQEKTYQTKSHEQTKKDALKWIEQQGGEKKAANALLAQQILTPLQMEAAITLLPSLEKSDLNSAVSLVRKLKESDLEYGRAISYHQMLAKVSPTAYAEFYTRALEDAGVKVTEQMKQDAAVLGEIAQKGAYDAVAAKKASPELQKWLTKTQAYVEKGKIDFATACAAKIESMASEKMPASIREKFRALQRIGLLSNPKTHIRNILGNATMAVTEEAAKPIARLADNLLSKITGQKSVGTASAGTYAKGAARGVQDAFMQRNLGIDLQPGTKYSEPDTKRAVHAAKPFNNDTPIGKFGNMANDMISLGLSVGDSWAFEGAFQQAKAEIADANGIKVEEMSGDMIDAALQSALRRTFRDDNKATEAFSAMRNSIGLFGDTLAPFVKTPVNVIKIGLELSPVGVVEAVTKTFRGKNSLIALKKSGKSTIAKQREIAELFGRGAIGTAFMLLGKLLKEIGAVSGAGAEDEKERALQQAEGFMQNALHIGDTYYDISSLQTLATPLMAGAALYEGNEEDKNILDADILRAMANLGNTALEMPVLQGVKDLLGGNYQSESLVIGLVELAADAASQALPGVSLLRQVAKMQDPYARTTSATGEQDALVKAGKEMVNGIIASIPGLRETLPVRYDVLGNPIENDASETLAGRAFNTFVNPFNTSRETHTAVTDELGRLYERTQDAEVLPGYSPYNVSYDGEQYKFNAQERAEFQKTEGAKTAELLSDLFASSAYKTASSEQKNKMVQAAMDYAADTAKEEYLQSKNVKYESDAKWMNTVRELKSQGMPEADAVMYRQLLNAMSDAGYSAAAKGEFIRTLPGVTDDQRDILQAEFNRENYVSETKRDVDWTNYETTMLSFLSATQANGFKYARQYNIPVDNYYDAAKTVGKSGNKAEAIAALVGMGYSESGAYDLYAMIKGNKPYDK